MQVDHYIQIVTFTINIIYLYICDKNYREL